MYCVGVHYAQYNIANINELWVFKADASIPMKRKHTDQVMRHVKRFKSRFNGLDKKLEALNGMIGMADVKECILDQLKFLLCNEGSADGHFLHTVISGPSGCGKTTLARVVHELWTSMDIFENNQFTILHRSDLVGGYMGQTAAKTKKVLNRLIGGCIFIDEFYSLMYDNDTYGRECIDVLNTFMSEHDDTVIIVAGYKDEMERLFEAQPGLKRRFAWNLSIPKYTSEELVHIFKMQLSKHGWSLENTSEVQELFNKDFHKFKYQGGDTFNLCLKSKIEYSKRNWRKGGKKNISTDDVQAAMQSHFKHTDKIPSMYM
jgi:SpoVK/Ycf46/Vps4 family AAA+-type ATPase